MALKCSVFIATSLDGYIARQDGSIDWLTAAVDAAEDYGYGEFYSSVDSIVIGRKTYETVLTFSQWPYKDRKVAVLTKNPDLKPGRMAGNVDIVTAATKEAVDKLNDIGCKHAYVDGGQTIHSFLSSGLIEEMTITTVPLLLGNGIRLFGMLNREVALQRLETRTFENGFVQTKYRIVGHE